MAGRMDGGWMYGWIYGWIDRGIDGWDGWMETK